MFEPLPFYNGKILDYKQFFFYIFFLVLFCLIFLASIVDLSLNVSLYYYRKTKRKQNETDSDEEIVAFEEKHSINSSFRKKSINEMMVESYVVENENETLNRTKKINTQIVKNKSKLIGDDQKQALEVEDSKHSKRLSASRSVEDSKDYKSFKEETIHVQEYGSDDDLDQNNDNEEEPKPKPKKSKIRCLYHAILASELVIIFCFILLWDSFNAFEIVYSGAFSLIFKSIICYGIIAGCVIRYSKLYRKKNYFLNPYKPLTIKIIIIASVVILVFFANWGMMTLVKGLCIANHNQDTSGLILGSYAFTTAIGRHWSDSTCPKDTSKPCFIYATLPEDGLHSVFITFHINPESCTGSCDPKIDITPVDNNTHALTETLWAEYNVTKGRYKLPDHEYEKREVYTCLIKDLEPAKLYAIKIVQSGWTNPQIFTYQNFNTSKMTIINGGDIGNNKNANMINENVVAKQDADVIFVGGDIAYDNGFPECYQCYDNVMSRLPYKKVDTETGVIRIVPVMFSVGNHDFGVNTYSNHKLDHDDTQPIFKHFYPQNTNENMTIPDLKDRKSYFAHSIGDRVLFLSLDTGYEANMDGRQTEWLEQQLSNSTYDFIFAQYHNPIYSACSKGDKGEPANLAKKNWVPLFDQYNLTMGFENHVHGFKRTKVIRNGYVSDSGTVFIGDGSWGPLVHSCKPINQDIIEKYGIYNHVWVIELDETNIVKATAYNEHGDEVDYFEHEAP